MKNVDDLSEEEVRAELERLLLARAKRPHFSNRRREAIEKDPKAYFTRRKDFEQAEKLEQDVDFVPKLNVCG